MIEILKSELDDSVNFVERRQDGGALETRYVRRVDDYFSCYLSSHTGCNKSCRFCHLTATGQTMMNPASVEDYVTQAMNVMNYYSSLDKPAKRVNFNFMARGEPLANENMLFKYSEINNLLTNLANDYGVVAKFNISTIFPHDVMDINFSSQYNFSNTFFYYSLYSLDEKFRKKWLPKSVDPKIALSKLAEHQDRTGNIVTLHWAIIKGWNDTEYSVYRILDLLDEIDLNVKFNIVRYNPYDERYGEESDEETIQNIFNILTDYTNSNKSKIVQKVGFDVKASCGMFVNTVED